MNNTVVDCIMNGIEFVETTEDDLISRRDAIDVIKAVSNLDEKAKGGMILNLTFLQAADPKRKKGKWQITDAYPHNVYCSECHKRFAQTHWSVWKDGSLPRNFCPNCGAQMKGEANENQ